MVRVAPATFARQLVIVTGKGGVGKSTVAAGLAIAAARRGSRTVVVEVSGRADVARLLGGAPGAPLQEVEVEPRLSHVTIEPHAAVAEYLRAEIPARLPATILARSTGFRLLVDAAPGMAELLTIGKVWELAQPRRHLTHAEPYDLVVLDAPATGHALALLGSPRTFASVARVGLVARQGAAIDALLHDPRRTAVIAVAAPEQMAVSETLALRSSLAADLGLELDAVVVNRVLRHGLAAGDRTALAAVSDDPAVRSARWLDDRARAQHAHIARLRRGVAGIRCMTLPFRFCDELRRADLDDVAGELARGLA